MGTIFETTRRPSELNLARHLRTVGVAQVAIRPHRQYTTIRVPKPATNGWNVHARLDTTGREKVAQVVMRDARDTHDLACSGE